MATPSKWIWSRTKENKTARMEAQNQLAETKTLTLDFDTKQFEEGMACKYLFVCYDTVEDSMREFFTRVKYISLKLGNTTIYSHITGIQWSMWVALEKMSILRNPSVPRNYVPIPLRAFNTPLLSRFPLSFTIEYNRTEQDEERTFLRMWTSQKDPQFYGNVAPLMFVLSPMVQQEIKQGSTNVTLDYDVHFDRIDRVAFHLPNANQCLKSGSLWCGDTCLRTFESKFDVLVLDSYVNNDPDQLDPRVSKHPAFTFTFVPPVQLRENSVQLRLDLHEDDIPPGCQVEMFAETRGHLHLE